MALDGVHRHVEYRRDFRQIEVLLEAQRDDDPRLRAAVPRPAFATAHRASGRAAAASHRAPALLSIGRSSRWRGAPDPVDAAVAGDAPQPEHQVCRRLDPRQVLVQGEKHVLRELFCLAPQLCRKWSASPKTIAWCSRTRAAKAVSLPARAWSSSSSADGVGTGTGEAAAKHLNLIRDSTRRRCRKGRRAKG